MSPLFAGLGGDGLDAANIFISLHAFATHTLVGKMKMETSQIIILRGGKALKGKNITTQVEPTTVRNLLLIRVKAFNDLDGPYKNGVKKMVVCVGHRGGYGAFVFSAQ